MIPNFSEPVDHSGQGEFIIGTSEGRQAEDSRGIALRIGKCSATIVVLFKAIDRKPIWIEYGKFVQRRRSWNIDLEIFRLECFDQSLTSHPQPSEIDPRLVPIPGSHARYVVAHDGRP